MNSLAMLMALVSGLAIFGGACYLVATRRPLAALAAYLVLLPLPILIVVCGFLKGMWASLSVISASPDIQLPTTDTLCAL